MTSTVINPLCFICGSPTDPLSADPSLWITWISVEGGGGVDKPCHTGCVAKKIQESKQVSALRTELAECRRQLVESQAREVVLREAMTNAASDAGMNWLDNQLMLARVLESTPADHTALAMLLKPVIESIQPAINILKQSTEYWDRISPMERSDEAAKTSFAFTQLTQAEATLKHLTDQTTCGGVKE